MSGQYKNQVRIIGGTLKRRLLRFPLIDGLRPTPDRVRETLFNWLGQDCTGLACLDLFAGSGALGFEAASRNAARVVAVEAAKPALEALRANKTQLVVNNLEVVWGDGRRFVQETGERFDLVFLDPPFASDFLAEVLPILPRILKPGAMVYAECAAWPSLQGWELIKEARAGMVNFGLLRRVEDAV